MVNFLGAIIKHDNLQLITYPEFFLDLTGDIHLCPLCLRHWSVTLVVVVDNI